jgi:hypothetical protein
MEKENDVDIQEAIDKGIVMVGHADIEIDTVEWFACTKCGNYVRLAAKKRRFGDIQINITKLCNCIEIDTVRVWFKKAVNNDG